MIACDWIPSESKDNYTVSIMDAQLFEVNNVVVFEEQVFFSERFVRFGEVYTIQVDGQSTQFTPIGVLLYSLSFL